MMKKIRLKGLVLSFALCLAVMAGGAVETTKAAASNSTWNCVYGPNHSIGSSGGKYLGYRNIGDPISHNHNGKICFQQTRVDCYLRRCPCGYEVVVESGAYIYHTNP